ncbi:Mariner Mos1 transposase [Eumeta japonica]|uniref:Mariner Mos1 transposase n=1 Tax=Eumeta variegata TaxID=151549 RepID=A0A4C1WJH2_EUMVA|nr:Mariner Mos1 transposase [Eumeta japonica]
MRWAGLEWEVLLHRPYPPDIAPSDYHLFRSMTHALSEQRFTSYEDTKNWVDSWIASKDKEFFRLGIQTLPERWKKVVTSYGQYFD